MDLQTLQRDLENSSARAIHVLIQQVEKDFLMSGFNFEYTGAINLSEFYEYLHDFIRKSLQHGDAEILNLLYRIDVANERIPNPFTVDQVTDSILNREVEKIRFRLKFSSE